MKACHALIPGMDSSYGYTPSLIIGIIFSVLFGISFLLVSTYFSLLQIPMLDILLLVSGDLQEISRMDRSNVVLEMSIQQNGFPRPDFDPCQVPIFFGAAIYLILPTSRGAQYSILEPKAYLWAFCTAEFLILLIQARGGCLASSEFTNNNYTEPSSHIIPSRSLYFYFDRILQLSIFSSSSPLTLLHQFALLTTPSSTRNHHLPTKASCTSQP